MVLAWIAVSVPASSTHAQAIDTSVVTARDFDARLADLKVRLADLRETLPETPQRTDVERALLTAAGRAGNEHPRLNRFRLSFSAPVSANDYSYLGAELEGEGGAADALRFVSRLEHHPRLLVHEWALSPVDDGLLRFKVSLRAPYLPSGRVVRTHGAAWLPRFEGLSAGQIDEYSRTFAEFSRVALLVGELHSRRGTAVIRRMLDWLGSIDAPLLLAEARLSRDSDELVLRGTGSPGTLEQLKSGAARLSAPVVGSKSSRDGRCVALEMRLDVSSWGLDLTLLDSQPWWVTLHLTPPGPCRLDRDTGPATQLTVRGSGSLFVHLADFDVADVIRVLHEVSGAGFVVDGDVRGRVDVAFEGVTLEEALAALLRQLDLGVSDYGAVRRVSRSKASLRREHQGPWTGQEVSFAIKRGPSAELLSLFQDISGLELFRPHGDLGHVSVFAVEVPWDAAFAAVLDASGLASRLDDDNFIRVFHAGSPDEPLALSTSCSFACPNWQPQDTKAEEFRLSGLAASGTTRKAYAYEPDGPLRGYQPGEHLAGGVVKVVARDHVVVEAELPVEGKPPLARLLRFTLPQLLPPVTTGHDTTRISSPLLSDGTPDYGAWLNARYGADVTPENNAADALETALRGLVGAGVRFFDRSSNDVTRWYSETWNETDCPECAALLERNERPLSGVVEAVRRTRHFVPLASGVRLSGEDVPWPSRLRRAAEAIASHGMLRLGKGEIDGAIEDAVAVQRLASLVDQAPRLIDRIIGFVVREIGVRLLPRIAASPSFTREAANHLLRELQTLPPMSSMADTLDHAERLETLDRLLFLRERAARRGSGSLLEVLEPAFLRGRDEFELEHVPPELYLLPATIDWDEALRNANRAADLALNVLRSPTPEARQRARAAAAAEDRRLQRECHAVRRLLRESVGAAADRLVRTPTGRRRLASLLTPVSRAPVQSDIALNEAAAQLHLGVSSVALAVHFFRQSGRYPENLDGLAPSLRGGSLDPRGTSPGYTVRYHVESTGDSARRRYALMAVPQEPAETGRRAFCVDSTGAMRFKADGSVPNLVDGVCDPAIPLTR